MTGRLFVDANVFISDGRPPGGDIVRALLNLVRSGKLSILSTDITINEVTKHFASHDAKNLGALLKPQVRALIKDITSVVIPEMSTAELDKLIWERNYKATIEMMTELQAHIVKVDEVSPSSVFIEYATGRGMFAEGGKKDQFPDAFILKALELQADGDGVIWILSKDNDFARAVTAEGKIAVFSDLGALLKKLSLKVSDADIAKFLDHKNGEIVERASEAMLDFFVYVDDHSELEGEVQSVNAVEIMEIDNFEIDEHETLVTGTMKVSATISYSGPDMSTAIYDHEDKRAYAFRSIDGEADEDFSIAFTMTILNDQNGIPESIASLNFVNDGPLYVSIYDDYK